MQGVEIKFPDLEQFPDTDMHMGWGTLLSTLENDPTLVESACLIPYCLRLQPPAAAYGQSYNYDQNQYSSQPQNGQPAATPAYGQQQSYGQTPSYGQSEYLGLLLVDIFILSKFLIIGILGCLLLIKSKKMLAFQLRINKICCLKWKISMEVEVFLVCPW